MRVSLHSLVAVCLAASVFASAQGQGGDATRVLAATREALGGDQKLAAVKTFVATGRTRQIRGNNLVPIEFEIACELPDKYVRRDEIPAQESGPTATGFNGEALIQVPPPEPPPPPANPTTKPPVAPASNPAGANPASAGSPGPPVPPVPTRNPGRAVVVADLARRLIPFPPA